MNAAEVIKEAAVAGIQIAIEGDGLSLEAIEPPPEAIIELITQHKPEIINLLRSRRGGPAESRLVQILHTDSTMQVIIRVTDGIDPRYETGWLRDSRPVGCSVWGR